MKSVAYLSVEEAKKIEGIVFDLDDTVLDNGVLQPQAHQAIFRAQAAGLRLILATGRPAGWAEVLLRLLPIDGAIAENGSVGFWRSNQHIESFTAIDQQQQQKLKEFAATVVTSFPVDYADDNRSRWCDTAIDINERRTVSADVVKRILDFAHHHGIRTMLSSIHLHFSCDGYDKASGVAQLMRRCAAIDATELRGRYAFVGDSANDAACFAAFATTIGVANVREHLPRISVGPRYITTAPKGAGFREFVDTLIDRRT